MPSGYELAIMSYLAYDYVSAKQKNDEAKEKSAIDAAQGKRNHYNLKKDLISKDSIKFLFFHPRLGPDYFLNKIVEHLSGRYWQIYLEPDEVDSPINDGYLGLAFINSRTQEIVIAHRGTVVGIGADSIANYKDDIEILKGSQGLIPEILDDAIEFIVKVIRKRDQDRFDNYQLFQTGHSLGGFLAEFGAAYVAEPSKRFPVLHPEETALDQKAWEEKYTRLHNSRSIDANAVTFDSLGAGNILKRPDIGIRLGRAKTVNYLPGPSIVNTANPHDGERRLLCKADDSACVDGIDHTCHVFLDSTARINFKEVQRSLEIHRLKDMMGGFDPETGEPYSYKTIKDWPTAINIFEQSANMPTNTSLENLDDVFHATVARFVHSVTEVISFSHKRSGSVTYFDTGERGLTSNTHDELPRLSLVSFNNFRQKNDQDAQKHDDIRVRTKQKYGT